MKKKKILITGGNGFIGRNLKEKLTTRYNIFAPTSAMLDLLDDVNVKRYMALNRFDVILHCATHNATRTSLKDTNKVFDNNIRMFINILRCSNDFGKMIYFGSGAEYGLQRPLEKIKEDYLDTYVPRDQYGFSKYIMAKSINSTGNIYELILFGCFGKYEDWRIRFISNNICRTLYGKNMTLSQNAIFDYLYINDLVRIVKWFVDSDKIQYRRYNVCSGKSVSLLEVAKIIRDVSDKKNKIIISKKGFKNEYSGDNTRLIKEIGEFDFTTIYDSIKDLYEWYTNNKNKININELVKYT